MTRTIPSSYEEWAGRQGQEDREGASRRLESQLRELLKQYHHSDPMTACCIEPKIREKAQEYEVVSGRAYFYSLAREEQ